jgi:predicted DNA-binding transcriptional regulator AlpA
MTTPAPESSDFYENRILSLPSVAQLASLSLSTLRREIQRGTGPKITRISRRRVGVRRADVRLWLIERGTAK